LPKTDDDPTRRFQYDTDLDKYQYFPVSPLTYMSRQWISELDTKFTSKPISFSSLASEFNNRQNIFVPTPALLKMARDQVKEMVC
jgi:hypothetical protein